MHPFIILIKPVFNEFLQCSKNIKMDSLCPKAANYLVKEENKSFINWFYQPAVIYPNILSPIACQFSLSGISSRCNLDF